MLGPFGNKVMLGYRGDETKLLPCLGSGRLSTGTLAENSSTTNSLSDTGGVFLGLTGFRGRFGVSSFAHGESLLVLSSYAMAHKGKMISIHALQIQECWL
jgi:hypothetical protein